MAQGACPPRDHLSSHAPPPLAVTSRSCRRGDKAARGRGQEDCAEKPGVADATAGPAAKSLLQGPCQ